MNNTEIDERIFVLRDEINKLLKLRDKNSQEELEKIIAPVRKRLPILVNNTIIEYISTEGSIVTIYGYDIFDFPVYTVIGFGKDFESSSMCYDFKTGRFIEITPKNKDLWDIYIACRKFQEDKIEIKKKITAMRIKNYMEA